MQSKLALLQLITGMISAAIPYNCNVSSEYMAKFAGVLVNIAVSQNLTYAARMW